MSEKTRRQDDRLDWLKESNQSTVLQLDREYGSSKSNNLSINLTFNHLMISGSVESSKNLLLNDQKSFSHRALYSNDRDDIR